MAQVTLDTEDLQILTHCGIHVDAPDNLSDEREQVEALARRAKDLVLRAESIESSEDLAGPEMAPKPYIVEGGIVMGSVSTGYVGSQKTFELCSLEEWKQLTAKEADQLFEECLWENIDAGY